MMQDPSAFAWHPEPELIGVRDQERSRPALEQLGAEAWAACLDYLYGEAMRRPVGPDAYPELRRRLFPAGEPDRRPRRPPTFAEVLREFRSHRALPVQRARTRAPSATSRLRPSCCPSWASCSANGSTRASTSGTPSPSAALVEEEVVRWLTDLVGYGPESFGVLTSGGVMANVMALTLARDLHLGAHGGPRAARPGPRGRPGLRLRPGPLLHRPRPRLPGLPARTRCG